MNGILKRLIVLVTAIALVAVPCMTCFAEGLEQDDDLIAGKMAAEVVVRPLGLVATVLGGATLITAHLRNAYFCLLCRACGREPCVGGRADTAGT